MHLFLAIFICISLNASSLSWHGDYETAHKKALKQNKNLLILLVDKDSVLTKKVIKNSFMNQKYIDKINTVFVSILLTKGQKLTYPIELLYTTQYPALFLLNKYELYICEKIDGDITPNQLEKHLESCF